MNPTPPSVDFKTYGILRFSSFDGFSELPDNRPGHIYVREDAYDAYLAKWLYMQPLIRPTKDIFLEADNRYHIMDFNSEVTINADFRILFNQTHITDCIFNTILDENIREIVNIGEVVVNEEAENLSFTIRNINPTNDKVSGNVTLQLIDTTNNVTYDEVIEVILLNENYEAKGSYTVSTIEGCSKSFYLNSDGWYESTNQVFRNSYSACAVTFTSNTGKVYFDMINSGEKNHDYGLISYLNARPELTYSYSLSNVKYQFYSATEITSEYTQDFGVIAGRSYTVYFLYKKDDSTNSGKDCLRFRVRFE